MNPVSQNEHGSAFEKSGFIVVPDFLAPDELARCRQQALSELRSLQEPIEYEADIGYDGAPSRRDAPGGATPRRLLSAYQRSTVWADLATSAKLKTRLLPLLGERPMLSQSHHNCIMTKHPGFSSSTNWHQDIRYWSFEKPELVTAWIALTDEHAANGALLLLPGSHRASLHREQFDDQLFLQTDLPSNQALIDSKVQLSLSAGDLLLFHCRVLHAAGQNQTDNTKLSAVFTYHGVGNSPLPGTRSAQHLAVAL